MATNRIDGRFAELRAGGARAFVAYLTAGDPSPAATPGLVLALERAGCDIIELGVPFSDPIADGPTIQQAFQRALGAGAHLGRVLEIIAEVRRSSQVPIVVFSYYNPVMRYGDAAFVADAVAAGADGLLLLDMPPEEAGGLIGRCDAEGLRWVTLVAPTTPLERLSELVGRSSGFVYLVSREGVTGARESLSGGIADGVARIRKQTSVPVCVGFGISTERQVREVAAHADGVVVGSAIVKVVAECGNSSDLCQRVEAFARPLADAAHGKGGL
ncbi:MAG TPA: tryptophan synthase subunit alpha [Verrucomicrobiae bacterium]|nr:tryptophan synthase subunit alpha [Verrucomicrobiae bacterium]